MSNNKTYKSNLTDEQQKLVRTPEFKKWFGDWELLQRAKQIYKTDVKGLYKGVFDIDVEEALFTVSVQIHSSVKNMTNGFSQEILDIAEALYPNTKLGDEFYPVVSKVVDGNGEPTKDSVLIYLYSVKKENTNLISKIFNVSISTIYRSLERLGITNDFYEAQGVNKDLIDKGLKLYKEGKSLREIASILGVNKSSVNRWVIKEGIIRTYQEAKGVSLEDVEIAIDAYKKGLSLKLSGELIGVSDTAVLRWLEEKNIPIRSKSESQSKRANEGRQPIRGIRLYLKKDEKEIRADSIYEAARIIQLINDENIKDVERYNGSILLPNGKRYSPDLILTLKNGHKIVEEIKPDFQKENEDVLFKAKSAQELLSKDNIEYRIITETIIGRGAFELLKNTNVRLENKDDYERYNRALNTAINQTKILNNSIDNKMFSYGGDINESVYEEIIHSKSFKDWFGDWENDPKNSSKVVDEFGKPLIVYHGFLSYSKKDWFYEFNRLPAFFSANRRFSESYAETKSMDAGLDMDANSYECFLNIKKLFDPNDKLVIELAKQKLPEKINVSHGTMWFLDADLDKEYVVEMMSGIQTIYPDRMTDTILKLNVGDIFEEPVSMSQKEERILLYKDEDWAYTVDLKYFNDKMEKEVADYVLNADRDSRKSIKYKDKYFEPYVIDEKTWITKPNEEPIAVEFRNDLENYKKNFIENVNTLKRVEDKDDYFEIPLKDYEKLKGYWGGTISIKKRNLKSYKVKAKDNWTMFENETVQKFLLENGFGGWIAFEKGDKTYAVYEAQNIKLADGTNKTFDINNKDIRFDKGGQLTNEEKDDIYSRWKNLINMSYSELEKFYNSEEGREAGLSNKEANKLGIDSGRESARWIMKMKKTNKSEWTPLMWRWAKKQISFVSRMKGNKGGLYDEKGEKTRKHTSLLIWGHNPNKKSDGGSIAIEKVNKPKVDQLGFYSPIEKRILEFKSDRASVNKWKDIVGIKSDEAKFTGLSDYLNSKKPDEQLLKIELLNFIKDNHIELVLLNKNDSNTFLGETYIKERENGTYALAYRDTDEFVNDDEFDSPQELTDVYENEEIFSGNDVPYKTKYSKYVIKGNAKNYTELLVMLPDKAQQNRLFYNKLFNLLSEQVKERMGIVPNTIEWNTFNIYDYKSKLTSDELHQLNYIDSLSNVRHNTFSTVHWDERNILVHLRFDIRKDENENDVLFINELQSDWGQRGKKSGFGGKYDINLLNKELKEAEYEYNKLDFHNLKLSEIWETPEANRVMDIKEKINQEENSIPLAPFVTDTNKWVKLGLKIAIQQAVLNNVKYLSWGAGEQQNELYDLSKSLNKISWWHVGTSENTWGVTAYDKNDKITKKERDVTLSDIEKLLGKDIAEKIKNHEGYTESVGQTMYGELTGDNLKLSGSGMIAFYGSVIKNELGIVGNVLKSLVKELTGKSDAIQTIKIPEGKGIVGNPTIEQLEQAKKLAHDSNDSDSVDFLQEQIDRMKSGKEYSYGLFNSNVPASFFFDKVREPSIYTEYAIEITDELKKSVDEGIPMFKVGGQIKAKNPYSICTVSLGRVIGTQKRSKWTSAQLKKYERCVLNVKKTMKDGGGVSVEDGGQFVVLSKMDNNRYVIYSDKYGYKITVNNPDDAKYIELFYDGKRIGVLEAREHYLNDYHGHTGKFLSIQAAYIDDGHKNKGFGLKMYQALKEFSADDIIGFFSDLENRQNKKVIPKIYSHFNNEIVGDYHIVTYNDGGVVSQTLYFAIYRMEDGNEHWYMVAKHEINNDEQIETVKKLLDRAVDDNFKVKSITKKEYEDWDLGDEITTDEPTQFFKEGEISGEDYEKKQKGGSLCKCKFRTNRVPSKRINEYLLSLRK